jgi:hypothetical protein
MAAKSSLVKPRATARMADCALWVAANTEMSMVSPFAVPPMLFVIQSP